MGEAGALKRVSFCAVKNKNDRDEFVQLREFWNDVFFGFPNSSRCCRGRGFFGGEPFHAAGETRSRHSDS